MQQLPDEAVDTYYSRYRRIVQCVETTNVLSDAQKLYYFNKGLLSDTLPIIMMQAPANVDAALGHARTYGQGKDFVSKTEPTFSSPLEIWKRILKH